MDWGYLVAGAAGYLLGAIPTGYVMGRLLRGIDVRDYGSGKMGGTNTLRTLGLRVALIVMVVDIAKGAVAVLIARAISDEPYVQTVAGLAAVAGHVWPVYVGFRGGRGVGTSFGALLAMNPLASLALLPVAIAVIAISRYMSLMSVGMAPVAAALFLALAVAGVHPYAYAVFALVVAALIVALHRDNIERLLSGSERRIGEKERVRQPGRAQEGP
jgi:acyl phosphate:glycerol-3-phosphate acyltransferase